MSSKEEILDLKYIIIKLITDLENFILTENDIDILIEKCYKLNNYLKNKFFDDIIYDTQLKQWNNYGDFYIFENIDKIKKFLNSSINI